MSSKIKFDVKVIQFETESSSDEYQIILKKLGFQIESSKYSSHRNDILSKCWRSCKSYRIAFLPKLLRNRMFL